MVTNVEVIRKLGWICGIGAILAFVATIILIPMFASSRIGDRLAPVARHGMISIGIAKLEVWLVRRAELMIDWIINHAGLITLCGIMLMLWQCSLLPQLEPNNRLTENLPEKNESVQALFHIDRALGGMLPGFVVIEWDQDLSLESKVVLAVIEQTQRTIEQHAGASHPISVLNLLRALPGDGDLASRVPLLMLAPQKVVHRFVRPDRRRAAVAFFLKDEGVAIHEPTFRAIEQQIANIEQQHSGVRLSLTGTVVVASRNINQMITDLAKSVGLATVVIFITMAVVFRSLKLGLISLLPNAFPLITTAAYLVLTHRPLELTSVIVFSICLGIAVDDTIHVINRFQRELAAGHDVPAAIKRTFIAVGSALTTTTIVLIVGFGVVSISEMPPSQLFAKLGMIAIFSALIGDLILLPAMLVFFLRKAP
jgi:predicted RND superfamily exporter protein